MNSEVVQKVHQKNKVSHRSVWHPVAQSGGCHYNKQVCDREMGEKEKRRKGVVHALWREMELKTQQW